VYLFVAEIGHSAKCCMQRLFWSV